MSFSELAKLTVGNLGTLRRPSAGEERHNPGIFLLPHHYRQSYHNPVLGSAFQVLRFLEPVPWPDSPALFLSLLRPEGINVLENGSSRFHGLAGSPCGSLDLGQ